VHPKVHSMSASFNMYLLHLDNDLSFIGSASARNIAPFRMHLQYLNSVSSSGTARSWACRPWRRWKACSERPSSRRRRRPATQCSRARKAWEASCCPGLCDCLCTRRLAWFRRRSSCYGWDADGDSLPRGDGGDQQRAVECPDPGVAGKRLEFDARGCAQHHREQLPRRDAFPVPRADESAHRSPREEHVRMTLKPSSFGSEVGMFGLRRWPHCGGE
jgi:hypothetical protein